MGLEPMTSRLKVEVTIFYAIAYFD